MAQHIAQTSGATATSGGRDLRRVLVTLKICAICYVHICFLLLGISGLVFLLKFAGELFYYNN